MSTICKAKRFGNFQTFGRTTERDDGRYQGSQLGFMTYDKDDNYKVTYLEVGMRCDHIVDPIVSRIRPQEPLSSSTPLASDADLIRPNPTDEAIARDRASRNGLEAVA
jgi:hypothetical protein